MIVVSNTSPLHYLFRESPPSLTATVHEDLRSVGSDPRADSWQHPAFRAALDAAVPDWLELRANIRPLGGDLVAALDEGEAEAIQLAEEITAGLLILDEWKGRRIAQRRGLPITGALGILGLAYQRQLLNDPVILLSQMRDQGFRIHEQLASRFQLLLRTRYAR